ncbi:MAG: hypothetical protein LBN24_00425 [Mediterranea sp.]|jgi:hypothetical protein|nr:hypothetical protein [Mediterranea sp.]
MNHNRFFGYLLACCMVTIFLTCCQEDTPVVAPKINGTLSLRCDLPGITLPEMQTHSSRMTIAEEYKVNEICVLFFRYENGRSLLTNKETLPSSAFTTGALIGSFSASVPYVEGKYNFIAVVANGNYYLGSLIEGQSTLSDFLKITFNVADGEAWAAASAGNAILPMTGAMGDINGTSNAIELSPTNSILHISLIRSLAKVEISNAAGPKFKITHIQVYNQHREGFLYGDGTNVATTVASLARHTEPLAYNATLTSGESYTGSIYLFEHEKGAPTQLEQAPRIVIEGIYDANGDGFDNDIKSFYAIDFTTAKPTTVGKDNLTPIRRNTFYSLTIAKILGTGATSPEEAMKAPDRSNIDYLLATLHGYSKVIFNEQYYFAYDGPEEFHLRRIAEHKKVEWLPTDGTPNYFRILTNHPQGASVRLEAQGQNVLFEDGKRELSAVANQAMEVAFAVKGTGSGKLTFYLPGQSGFSFEVPVEAAPKIRIDCPSNDQDRRGYVTIQGTYNGAKSNITDSCFVDPGTQVTFVASAVNGGVFDTYLKDGTPIQSDKATSKTYEIGKQNTDAAYKAHWGLWARSNVYWDGKQLTFEPAAYSYVAYTGNKNRYQGLLFKWGSLVGLSQNTNHNNDRYVYYPLYASNKWSWYGGKLGDSPNTDLKSWGNVPYCTVTQSSYNKYDAITSSPTYSTQDNWKALKGDICQVIGTLNPSLKGYRMPKDCEIANPRDWNTTYDSSESVTPNTTGTALPQSRYTQWATDPNVVVPVCGYLTPGGGDAVSTNSEGNFWSASAYSYIYAYYLRFVSATDFRTDFSLDRTYGFAVRCIKE